jgi:L-asparaginase II
VSAPEAAKPQAAAPRQAARSAVRPAQRTSRSNGTRQTRARARAAAPVLVRQVRNGIDESIHRGDVVEVDVSGQLIRGLGDPDRVVTARSTIKPFALVALIEAGGVAEYDLEPAELAVMAASHSGEDLHVRTIQAVFRRANVSQSLLACGSEGMPLDPLTAARLARDGERPGPLRHMCSGHHAAAILLSRLHGWRPDDYWREDHPSQAAVREVVARAFGTSPLKLRTAIDACGVQTFAFPLREVARAYALLADPAAVPSTDPRASLAPALTRIRDAMLAHPELVAGTHDRLDTSLMKALPQRVVSKAGAEGLRAVALLDGPRTQVARTAPSGLALKIDDGGGFERASWAATVEALRQAGIVDGQALRALARYHRPAALDPHGRLAAEAIAEFELAPLGELVP